MSRYVVLCAAVCSVALESIYTETVCAAAHQPAASQQETAANDPALREYLAGNGFLSRGLNELAAQSYEAFLQAHPDHAKAPWARYGLAVALNRLAEHERALETLKPLLRWKGFRDFEYAPYALLIAGQSHVASGRPAQALPLLDEVQRLYSDHEAADDALALEIEAAHRAGQHEKAATLRQAFVQKHPDSPFLSRALYFAGASEAALQRWEEALQDLTTTLRNQPDGPLASRAALLAAQCADQLDKQDTARALYEQALRFEDDAVSPSAALGLSLLDFRQGHLDSAAQRLASLLDQDAAPAEAVVEEATLLLARTRLEQGDAARAATLLQRLPGLRDNAEALYWLGKAQLRQNKVDAAVESLRAAAQGELDAQLAPAAHYDLALALDRSGQLEQAARELDQLLPHAGDLTPQALYLRAAIAHDQGDYQTSDERLEQLRRDHPDSSLVPQAIALLMENAALEGDHSRAATLARALLDASSDADLQQQARFRLGASLYALGKDDEAAAALTPLAHSRATPEPYRLALLMLGDIAFRQGKYDDAVPLLRDYLALVGPSAQAADDALLKLGLSLLRTDHPAEALPLFAELIESFPDSPHRVQALFEEGQALVAMGRDDQARERFASALREGGDASPFAPLSLQHLGAIADRAGQAEQAATLYAQAAALAAALGSERSNAVETESLLRQALALYRAEKWSDAARALLQFAQEHPDDPHAAEAEARGAIALSRAGSTEQANAALQRVVDSLLDALPSSLQHAALYELAWTQQQLGQASRAANTLEKLLRASPSPQLRAHGLVELAQLRMEEGSLNDAADLLRDALTLAQTTPQAVEPEVRAAALYRLGVCEHRLQRYDEAARAMEAYLAHPASDAALAPSAALVAGESRFQLGQHEEAADLLAQVIADDQARTQDRATAMLRLGESLAMLQRWHESEQIFQRYLDEFPDDPLWFQAQFGLGWALEHQQQCDKAIAAYTEVVQKHQGETAARAQFQIGECLFSQNKLRDAVRELLKVDILYAYPEWSAAGLYEAGRCYEALEQPQAARQRWHEVVNRFPDTTWATLARDRLEQPVRRSLPGGAR